MARHWHPAREQQSPVAAIIDSKNAREACNGTLTEHLLFTGYFQWLLSLSYWQNQIEPGLKVRLSLPGLLAGFITKYDFENLL
jgi:hypothetical protein